MTTLAVLPPQQLVPLPLVVARGGVPRARALNARARPAPAEAIDFLPTPRRSPRRYLSHRRTVTCP